MIDVKPLQTGQTGHTRYEHYQSKDFIPPISIALDSLTSGMPSSRDEKGWAVPPLNWVTPPTEGALPICPLQGKQPPFPGQASHQLPSTYREALTPPNSIPPWLLNNQQSSEQTFNNLLATFCKWRPNANGKLGETGFGNSGFSSTPNSGSPLSLCTQLPSPQWYDIRSLNRLSPPPVYFAQIPFTRTAHGYGEGRQMIP